MTVILHTDASHSPEKVSAGYAFWITFGKKDYKRWGKLKECKCITRGELMAIANGLHFIRNHPDLRLCTQVIINTDSLQSVKGIKKQVWTNKRKRKTKELRSIRGVVEKYLGTYNGRRCNYDLNHIPAHTDNTDTESIINKWCDKHAKLGAKL